MSVYTVVCEGVVGDGEDGDDVVVSQHTDQRGYWGVILFRSFCVFALSVQVAELIVALQDPRQDVHAIRLVMEIRLGGENQEVCAVVAPPNFILQ